MPWTTNKGFSTPAAGTLAGTWGADSTTPTANSSNALNEGVITLVDQALGGTTSLSLASSNVLLTQLQTQNGMLRMSGVLTANVDISPNVGVLMTGFYMFENLTTGNFSVTLTNGIGSVTLPQTRRGILWIDGTNGPRILAVGGVTGGADPIPKGTVMLFYQTAAPAGWTISAALNDYALKIVSATGGVTSGSVNYSTLFGRTATDSTTLTTSQIPSHTHGVKWDSNGATVGATGFAANLGTGGATATSDATGGGAGHTHPLDMRVKTASVILATKN